MNQKLISIAAALAFVPVALCADEVKPVRALLITGGGYHDYEKQKTLLTEGISERIKVDWTIVHKDAGETKELLRSDGWSDGVDVVVYNFCHADETDGEFIDKLVEKHAGGLHAVVIHCALHSYHWKTKSDAWVRLLGVKSMRHGKQAAISVKHLEKEHPILKALPAEWATPKGELYHIDQVGPNATVLADGSIDGWDSKHAVVWTNQLGDARIFGTSIGHHNETIQDANYLTVVSNGLLWAVGKLGDDGKPAEGYAKD
jgi:uncharacterized protein